MLRRLFERIPDRSIWALYGAVVLLGVAYGVSIAVLAIHLKDHGIPEMAMGGLAAAFALGIISMSVPSGWVVQRVGAKRTLIIALACYATCITTFPFLTTVPTLSIARFFDGACSVGIWVAAETALLSRSNTTNKAFVMSLYAMALGLGYVFGPILAIGVVKVAGTTGSFVAAGVLACAAVAVILARFDARGAGTSTAGRDGVAEEKEAERSTALALLWKIKAACLATFSYGYFQASVVLYLPLFLIEGKGVPKERTILITAFFALGMLLSTTFVGRLGDRLGHLLVMRTLGAIGGLMVASFVLLSSFAMMCGAVFVAGATLAAISPVSLALQGVIVPKRELGRANALYNAAYAAGMLLGPPISSVLFTEVGGGGMLLHLAALWTTFVIFTVVFADDDPRRRARATECRLSQTTE